MGTSCHQHELGRKPLSAAKVCDCELRRRTLAGAGTQVEMAALLSGQTRQQGTLCIYAFRSFALFRPPHSLRRSTYILLGFIIFSYWGIHQYKPAGIKTCQVVALASVGL